MSLPWPALRQRPFVQSSSSAQSSFFVHFFGRWHAPASQRPPGPHSPSDAHGLQEPAWQTCPIGHCSSLMHCAFATHAFALHSLPFGHWESSRHSTHLFDEQTWPFLQSLSPLQPGCFGLLPHALSTTAIARAAIATKTLPMA